MKTHLNLNDARRAALLRVYQVLLSLAREKTAAGPEQSLTEGTGPAAETPAENTDARGFYHGGVTE